MSGISTVAKIRYNPRGTYASNIKYEIDDMVFYLGSYYRCTLSTTATTPTTYSSSAIPWVKLSQTPYSQGEWSSASTYYTGDVVGVTTTLSFSRVYNYQENDTYICINSAGVSGNANYPPTDPSDWKLISKGSFNKKLAYLGDVNAGYVPTHSHIWDAKCGARPGGIGIVTVTNGGSGYTTTSGYPAGLSTATVTFAGPTGVGASAVAYVSAAGTIFAIEITNPGSGYSFDPVVTISGGGGSSATATAFSYKSKVGVGDTVGRFKGHHHDATGYAIYYINKQYGIVRSGYENETYQPGGFSDSDNYHSIFSESCFVHLDYLDGLLPTPDGEPPKVIEAHVNGHYQTLVLFNNGEVHYAGYNGHGQSGDSTTTTNTQFVRCGYANTNKSGNSVLRGKKAIRIASTMGSHNSNVAAANYALIENGNGTRELWSWGYNGYGQLADETTTNRSTPVNVPYNETNNGKIIEIWATGDSYGNLYVLSDTGKMFAAGYNGYGQLGDGTATSKSVLTRIGIGNTNFTWTAPLHSIKKFVSQYGNSTGSPYILTDNGRLWNWGYNGNNHSGHNHTYNIYYPIQVNTGGYSGVAAVRNYASGAGTTVGIGFTNVYDVWTKGYNGGAGSVYISVGSTTNPGVTTALATGGNAVRELSLGLDDTTARNIFVGMQTSSGLQLTGLVDVAITIGDTNFYGYGSIKTVQGPRSSEFYLFPYTNGRMGNQEGDSYNILQLHDPDFTASNYRLKPLPKIPTAFDYSHMKINPISATSYQYGGSYLIDLKTGRIYECFNNTNYGMSGYSNTGARYFWHRLNNH